jgi:hypothetical protein
VDVGDDHLRNGDDGVARDGPGREVEHAEHELHRVVGCLLDAANDIAVDAQREGAGPPVDAVGVLLRHVEGEWDGSEVLPQGRVGAVGEARRRHRRDLARHSRDDLHAVALALTTRPRKTLGWWTPAEAVDQLLLRCA